MHFCDSFSGEVILEGSAVPTASFYYRKQARSSIHERELYFNYLLTTNTTNNLDFQVLRYNGTLDSSFPQPDILAVSYDNKQIFADCNNGRCAFGNYSTQDYLTFDLLDLRTSVITRLHAADKEWEFNDDAPSVVLLHVQPSGDKLIALQTAVTKQNFCSTLKICTSASTPNFATLAPIGVILMAQQRYTNYCAQDRIRSN